MTPRVSVIMPFIREAAFIGEAIASVRNQSSGAWELILVDDGAQDGSRPIADAAAAADPARIRVLPPDPASKGAAAARNRGIAEARGEFVCFLDADDLFLPGKIASELAILEAHPRVGMLYGRTQWWWEDGARRPRTDRLGLRPDRVYEPPRLLDRILIRRRGDSPCTCAVMIRRALVLEAGGFDERFRLYEDQSLWVKLFLRTPVFVSSLVNCRYRQHAGSTSAIATQDGEYTPTGPHAAHAAFIAWIEDEIGRAAPDPALTRALAWQRSLYGLRTDTPLRRLWTRLRWRFGV